MTGTSGVSGTFRVGIASTVVVGGDPGPKGLPRLESSVRVRMCGPGTKVVVVWPSVVTVIWDEIE